MILTSSYFKEITESLTKQAGVAIIEPDNVYTGRSREIITFKRPAAPATNTHTRIQVKRVHLGAGASVCRFCSSPLHFNWISSRRSQACHRGQALLSMATRLH